jgi:hypothetical protein
MCGRMERYSVLLDAIAVGVNDNFSTEKRKTE